MELKKDIDYIFKSTLIKNNIALIPNQCHLNVIAAANFDSSKAISVGYSYNPNLNLCALHSWLESDSKIYEITYPDLIGKLEYYPILTIKLNRLNNILNHEFQTIETLINHRYYNLKFLKTYNYLAKKNALISLGNKAVKVERSKFPTTKARLRANFGRLEYLIKKFLSM